MTTETKKRGRKTKDELLAVRRNRVTNDILLKNKFLNQPKYYKNNYWSWAAWDSWAAQGKAGSCACGCGYYNATLKNKRAATEKGWRSMDKGKRWPVDVSRNLCSDCVNQIENKINYQFKRH